MTQDYEPKHITVLDPRTFDGDPFTVAQRAAEQAGALAALAAEQIELAAVMARNAHMERELQDGEIDPLSWGDSLYASKWAESQDSVRAVVKSLRILGRAAGYDPKHPPKV